MVSGPYDTSQARLGSRLCPDCAQLTDRVDQSKILLMYQEPPAAAANAAAAATGGMPPPSSVALSAAALAFLPPRAIALEAFFAAGLAACLGAGLAANAVNKGTSVFRSDPPEALYCRCQAVGF